MTYKESYMKCNSLEELLEEVEHDIFVAQKMMRNPDRIKVIKDSAEEVANLKFKKSKIKMDIKEFAKSLDGKQYEYPQFTKEEIQIAKDNGFVIVYGASDDLMEFDGAIYEEAGCFDGGKVYFDKTGACDEEFENSKCIEALWCKSETAWTYKTDIPHETFMIYEDEEPYCEAIVFSVANVN